MVEVFAGVSKIAPALNSIGVGGLMIGFAWLVITVAPRWRQIGVGQRKFDVTTLMTMMEGARAEAREANAVSHATQMVMVQLTTAFHMVAGELAERDPENQVLKQARSLVAMAAKSDYGMKDAIEKLSRRASRALGTADEATEDDDAKIDGLFKPSNMI